MYLIEMKNRAKTLKNLHQPPKLLPFLGMEMIANWSRAKPSLVGCSFFGDDTDVTGLIMADSAPWYAGPFDEKSVSAISKLLAELESRIAEHKDFYARLGANLQPDVQNIKSTLDRFNQDRSANLHAEHLGWLAKKVASLGNRPLLHNNPDVVFAAKRVAKMIIGKIVKP